MPRAELTALKSAAQSICDLVCPPECIWCEQSVSQGEKFCSRCRERFVSNYHRCQHCAMPVPNVVPNDDCHRCRPMKWKFTRVYTLGPYGGERRDAVVLMKKPPFELLRRAVAELMSEMVASELSTLPQDDGTKPLLIPVPNHWTHALGGAADSAGVLAKQIGKFTGWDVKRRLVRRTRKTGKQGMLAWSERAKNVRGAFEIPDAEPLCGRHVILVDDVLTSGATCGELAGRLTKAGARRVDILVAARGTGAKETSLETATLADKETS